MNRSPLVTLPAELGPQAQAREGRYVMGIDGGATKTLAAVLDLERLEVHIAHGGPSNEDAVGARAAVGALLSVADAAAQRAGVAPAQIARSVLAVAGTDTDSIQRHVHDVREGWIVVNDVVAAWAAATDARPGIGQSSTTSVAKRPVPWSLFRPHQLRRPKALNKDIEIVIVCSYHVVYHA